MSDNERTNTRPRKGQIATVESVAAVCDQLFREGEAITEVAVRQALGGGSTPVIYRYIRMWEEAHRRQFLALEEQAQVSATGMAPPDMPPELWEALKPAWERVVAQAAEMAEARLANAREALAVDQAALKAEAERVRELDARWQAERIEWSETIADLNTKLTAAETLNEGLSSEIRRLGLREGELKMRLATEGRQAYERQVHLETALAEAKSHHEADQARWLQQIDAARQEAKSTAQQAERREADLQRRLDAAAGELADTRIALERARVESNGRQAQLDTAQATIDGLRQDLVRRDQRIDQLLQSSQKGSIKKPSKRGGKAS